MYCKSCGRSLGNDPYIKFCAYCGVELDMPEVPPVPSTYTRTENRAPNVSSYSYSYSPSESSSATLRNEAASIPAPSEPKSSLKPTPTLSYYDEQAAATSSTSYTPSAYSRGMKWFKFLIYFVLWIGGIANIITGISFLSGESELFPGFYYIIEQLGYGSEFDDLNTFYGLATLALGIFTIVTRFKLAHFKASAPTLLKIVYLAPVILTMICYYLACSWIDLDFFSLLEENNYLLSIISSIVMVFLNGIYFKKRKELFIE